MTRTPQPAAMRFVLLVTYGCCLRCRYCFVSKSDQHMSEDTIRRSVDFLLTSSRRDLDLHFFGAEPLMLPFGVYRRVVAYAERRMRETGKRLRFVLTTNGVPLDRRKLDFLAEHKFLLELSLDGLPFSQNVNRPQAGDKDSYRMIVRNLPMVLESGIDSRVSMVVSPATAEFLPANLAHLLRLGFRDIFIMTACGMDWTPPALKHLRAGLEAIRPMLLRLERGRLGRFLNLEDWLSPFRMNTEIAINLDGNISSACLAYLVHDRRLLKKYSLGHISTIRGSIDDLDPRRMSNGETMRIVFRENKVTPFLSNNIAAGRTMARFVGSVARDLGRKLG